MKTFLVLTAALMIGATAVAAPAADSTASFKVSGNCGMCKSRVEKAAKAAGAKWAVWNEETKLMEVKFKPGKTSTDKLQAAVANRGHDTESHKAPNDVYAALPGCCLYRDGSNH
jgi:copper chaperone CopZ